MMTDERLPLLEVWSVSASVFRAAALAAALAAAPNAGAETERELVTGSVGDTTGRIGADQGVNAALLREAIAAAERGDAAGATERAQRLGNPVAQTLVEWYVLRTGGPGVSTARIQRFMSANRDWPGQTQLRTRAEQALIQDSRPAAEVIAFFRDHPPRSAHGRVALAIALAGQGQTDRAHALVREAWRTQDIPQALDQLVRERLPGAVTRAEERVRLYRILYRDRASEAMPIAQRLGGNELAIARAWAAVINRAGNAQALLDAVPQAARADIGYQFARIQHLRRAERFTEAAQLLLAAPRDPRVLINGDEWWVERRLVGRRMLEENQHQLAYRIVSQHAAQRDTERMEAEFHAGWIALRFLNDANAADQHFARLQGDAVRQISVARGAYWRGRAAQARGDVFGANQHFEAAARHRTTYYGQLAMARLNRTQLAVVGSPSVDEGVRTRFNARGPIRSIRMLAAAGLHDKARPIFADLASAWRDRADLALLARLGGEIGQVRFTLLVGKTAQQNGIALDPYAYPNNGVPQVQQIGPPVERALILALARQESTFDPRIRSSAGAIGLMQMLPSSAQQTARRFNVTWQPGRITDPVYNTQLGAAYLGEVIQEFGGSYILAFAAYNAGRGRVREWLQRFGDPRDPRVDPVDWVERIPFSETRNYVMRVMENLQVYRARLAGSSAQLLIDRDMRRRAAMPAESQ